MVNRVHPDTGKVADAAFDYRKIETVLRALEKEWGMTWVPGHHARGAGEEPPDRAQALSTGEVRQARRTGELPFPGEIRERMGDELNNAIENAKNWDELREALGRHGYRLAPTERGMKITDGERYAKASGVDERLGRFRLDERFGERLAGRTDGEPQRAEERGAAGPPVEKQVDRTPSPPNREEPLESVRGASSENGTTKRDAALPGERAAGEVGGRSSVYESLSGKPALERGEAARGGGAGQLLGAAAVAARPVSGEDGEKEAPLRALEVGLRGAAAMTGRSETSLRESPNPEQQQAAEKQPGAEARVPERSVPDRAADLQPARTIGEPSDLQTPPTTDPQVKRLVRDVQAYERGIQAEQGLSAAAGAYAEAELRWKAARRQGQEVTRLSQTFDRALGEAYRDPAKEAEMKALRQEMNRTGQPSAVLERIGRQARGLTSAQMYQVGRVLTPEQMGVVMKAAGIPARLARGYGR